MSGRLRRGGLAGLSVVVVGVIVAAVATGGPEGGRSRDRAKRLVATSEAAFGQHYRTLAQRRRAANIPTMMNTMGSSVHLHPILSLWVDGKRVPVPANIGIDPTKDPMEMAGLHTHDSSGTIHAEGVAEATLGQFFAIWGVPLSAARLGPYRAVGAKKVRMWVNGEPSHASARLKLTDGQRVTISYGSSRNGPAS